MRRPRRPRTSLPEHKLKRASATGPSQRPLLPRTMVSALIAVLTSTKLQSSTAKRTAFFDSNLWKPVGRFWVMVRMADLRPLLDRDFLVASERSECGYKISRGEAIRRYKSGIKERFGSKADKTPCGRDVRF